MHTPTHPRAKWTRILGPADAKKNRIEASSGTMACEMVEDGAVNGDYARPAKTAKAPSGARTDHDHCDDEGAEDCPDCMNIAEFTFKGVLTVDASNERYRAIREAIVSRRHPELLRFRLVACYVRNWSSIPSNGLAEHKNGHPSFALRVLLIWNPTVGKRHDRFIAQVTTWLEKSIMTATKAQHVDVIGPNP